VRVQVRVARDLHHELAGQRGRELGLLQADADVLRIHVGAVKRQREVAAAEHEHERLPAHARPLLRRQLRQRIEAVRGELREHRLVRHDAAAIEDVVAHQRRAAVGGEDQFAV
jgi:hypothetical protein